MCSRPSPQFVPLHGQTASPASNQTFPAVCSTAWTNCEPGFEPDLPRSLFMQWNKLRGRSGAQPPEMLSLPEVSNKLIAERPHLWFPGNEQQQQIPTAIRKNQLARIRNAGFDLRHLLNSGGCAHDFPGPARKMSADLKSLKYVIGEHVVRSNLTKYLALFNWRE